MQPTKIEVFTFAELSEYLEMDNNKRRQHLLVDLTVITASLYLHTMQKLVHFGIQFWSAIFNWIFGFEIKTKSDIIMESDNVLRKPVNGLFVRRISLLSSKRKSFQKLHNQNPFSKLR